MGEMVKEDNSIVYAMKYRRRPRQLKAAAVP